MAKLTLTIDTIMYQGLEQYRQYPKIKVTILN